MGTRGTITFLNGYCIGAFRNESSQRCQRLNAMDFFRGAPNEIIQIAHQETLQNLLKDIQGQISPSITTAFWSQGESIFSIDTFDDFIKNGGHTLSIQPLRLNEAIQEWKSSYDMTAEQTALLRTLYQQKIKQPDQKINLSDDDKSIVQMTSSNDLQESRISFLELDITL